MKAELPEDYENVHYYGKYNEYDFDNRITYDEETDSMYVYIAPPQGQVGAVLVYKDGKNMISIDTDEGVLAPLGIGEMIIEVRY